ncbi:MAG: hypothetical protein KAH13_03565 [Tenericutes bacterium]|nr:hypothetical protein [Mycoplasmatota bacterium]
MDPLKNTVIEELYSTLPWYKKVEKNLKNWFNKKIIHFQFPWRKLIVLTVIVVFVGTIYLAVRLNQTTLVSRNPYDISEFDDLDTVIAQYGNEIKLENSNFEFVFDNNQTTFYVYDKNQDITWSSNPDEYSNRFLNPVKLYYSGSLGAVQSIGVIDQAVDYDDYLLRVVNNSIEVLYKIGGKKEIDSSDFPTLISAERMEILILSKLEEGSTDYRRITEQAYVSGEVNGLPVWKLKEGIQLSVLERLYSIIYETCGYTSDDLDYDQQENGISVEDIYPYFEIVVKYRLNSDGLEVSIINDSIVEKEKYPLLYVDVLPYFGAGDLDDEGYIMVPDGSGGIIEFNSDRSFALPYNKRIYGEDYAAFKEEIDSNTASIRLPVTGVKKNNFGFISFIKKGAEMTNIISNISTQDNPYNQVYFRYNIREGELYEFTSINSSVSINQWTTWYNTDDFIMELRFIQKENIEYNDMAETYREYLLDNEIITINDNTRTPTLDLTLLGGYTSKENFLGIPYEMVKSLTNTEQVEYITETLINDGVENINLFYQGISNDGLKPTYMGDMSFNKQTGKINDFRELSRALESLGVNYYPEAFFNTAFTDKNINKNDDVVRNVFGEVVYNYGYNPAALYQDINTRKWYTLDISTYIKTFENLTESYNNIDVENIAFNDFGNQVYGSYHKKNTTFRKDNVEIFLQVMADSSFNEVMFRNPNLYALSFASVVTDVEFESTNYQIISKSIPFYQLVLSGCLDYSGKAFNVNDEYSFDYHVMKAIETVSNMSIEWTYESTVDLANTEYSMYYSTQYENWYDRVLEAYQELTDVGVFDTTLVSHMILTDDGLVTKSTYLDGTEIVFNYRKTDYSYNGRIVEAINYLKVEEALL